MSDLSRIVLFVALAQSLSTSAAAVPGATDDIRASFASSAKAYRPLVRWWWPGGDVDDAKLAEQLRSLDTAGFGGAEIQPFLVGIPMDKVMAPESGARINDYATPRFFAHVAAAAKAAQELGLTIDYTLGSAWPSGGGDEITPALASRELSVSHQTVRGPGPFQGKIAPPPLHARMGTMADKYTGGLSPEVAAKVKAQEKIVAVLAYRGTAPETKSFTNVFGIPDPEGIVVKSGMLDPRSVVVLTDRARPDGTLDWQVPDGEWQLLVFKQYLTDIRVLAGVGKGTKFVLDHLSREAFAAHAQRVFGNGQAALTPLLGRSFRALFVDSLELEADTYWSDAFLTEFKQRRGYDLVPFLPAIIVPGREVPYVSIANHPLYEMPDVGERVRADYRLTLSDLMIENFYQPLEDYARSRSLISRVQVHGAPVDLLRGYGVTSIPETESMAVETVPTDPILPLARSAADIYGRKIVSAESLCWRGNPYAPTPEMWKRRVDLFFAAGVNHLVFHGAPYPYLDDVPPGWHPFSPPYGFSSFFSPAHPYWRHLQPFTSYVARLQSVLQQTHPAVPVAILRVELGSSWSATPKLEQTVSECLAVAGYLSDLLNGDGLMRSSVDGRRLVTPGGTAFAALVLPDVKALRAEVAEKIAAVAQAGVPIVFLGDVPARDEGWLDHEQRDARVRAAIAAATAKGAQSISASACAGSLSEIGVRPNLSFGDGTSAPFIEKRAGERRFFFLYNPDETARHVRFEVASLDGAERWDPWSGEVRPQATAAVAGGSQVDLNLAPGESALLVFDPKTKPTKPNSVSDIALRTVPLGEKGWTFHGVGYGKDGRRIDVEQHLDALQDWTAIDAIKDLAGDGTYGTTFTMEASALAAGGAVTLDLDAVHDLADVKVNGQPLATLLMRPFTVDITRALHVGENTIEITVANSPNNAMVGRVLQPRQPGIPVKPYEPMPAGLLGPVQLVVAFPLSP